MEKVSRIGQEAQNRSDRKSNRAGQRNKRGDSKVESNDNPQIPDRGGDTRHPWPPFRGYLFSTTIGLPEGDVCCLSAVNPLLGGRDSLLARAPDS